MSSGPNTVYSDRLIFQIDKELRNRLKVFRFKHQYRSEASTIRILVWFALDLIDSGEPPPFPEEDDERVLGRASKNSAG
jgi:hypothetical protein